MRSLPIIFKRVGRYGFVNEMVPAENLHERTRALCRVPFPYPIHSSIHSFRNGSEEGRRFCYDIVKQGIWSWP